MIDRSTIQNLVPLVLAGTIFGTIFLPSSFLLANPVRWLKANQSIPDGAYLMPGKKQLPICAKRGNPGTLIAGKNYVCSYFNSKNNTSKWTKHYRILSISGDFSASWHKSNKSNLMDYGVFVKTPAKFSICRTRAHGRWFFGKLIDDSRVCEFSARGVRTTRSSSKNEVLLIRKRDSSLSSIYRNKATEFSLSKKESITKRKNLSFATLNEAPIKWIKAKNKIPSGAYRMRKESGSSGPVYICRVKHPNWGWFTGTLSSDTVDPRCNIGVGGVRTRHEQYQILAFNRGYEASWQPHNPQALSKTMVVASHSGLEKTFVCRVEVERGRYVVGRLERDVCTIPYTAQQESPVPVRVKFDVLRWKGGSSGFFPPQFLPIIKWVASEDDVPPDAFLSKIKKSHYVCRVFYEQTGYVFGTMKRLRDVVFQNGNAIPKARACLLAINSKVTREKRYEVLVFRSKYTGRWHKSDAISDKKSSHNKMRGSYEHLCAAIVSGEFITGTLDDNKCILPGGNAPIYMKKGYYTLSPVIRKAASSQSFGFFDGEYRCNNREQNTQNEVLLRIAAFQREAKAGPRRVTMRKGTRSPHSKGDEASSRLGVGVYYPHSLEFKKRRMAVAFGAQSKTTKHLSRTFVALINLSDISGNGDSLHMTSISTELVPIPKGGKRAVLKIAKWGKGEERTWFCKRIKGY
ncbi:MAG: hypothetical protein VX941_12665 [Pseudomonadota bacterium]|nr:hypothetical protein [Pseudomonadota bacterium]